MLNWLCHQLTIMNQIKKITAGIAACIIYMVFIISCKSSQVPQREEASQPEVFEYAPWGWRFEVPARWKIMEQSTTEKLSKRGIRAIREDSQGTGNIVNDEPILSLQGKGGEASYFMAGEWEYDPKKSVSYNRSRLERFAFFQRSLKERGDTEVSYTRDAVYLGDMFFEALYIVAEPDFSANKLMRQAVFETVYNGKVILIQIVSTDKNVYDQTLKAFLNSGFRLPEYEPTRDWSVHNLPNASFRLPDTFERSKRGSDSSQIYIDSARSMFIELKQAKKASGASLEKPQGLDMVEISANLDFGVSARNNGDFDQRKIGDRFIAGKRLFRGDFEFDSDGTVYQVEYAYVIGKKSDFKITFYHLPDQAEARKFFNQIIASIAEKEGIGS